MKYAIPVFRILILVALLQPAIAASQPNLSNIDPDQRFVWSETAGWINFRPTHGGVIVRGTHLLGFAWSENVGWIQLGADGAGPYANIDATNWGVNRAADGSLSGFAWSETAGWISFDTTHGQVVIDPASREFDGFAWSGNLGWTHFRNPAAGYGLAVLPSLIEVPTLGEWGLIVLVFLLGGFALLRMRKMRQDEGVSWRSLTKMNPDLGQRVTARSRRLTVSVGGGLGRADPGARAWKLRRSRLPTRRTSASAPPAMVDRPIATSDHESVAG